MKPQPTIQLPPLEYPALKYGYSNARVKGMKGLLLKQSELDELVKVGTIDAVVELLERTHYKEDLVALSLLYKGSTLVELAAGRHFASIARTILRITPEGDRKCVEALLTRWDLLNLKTIITAKRLGKKYEEIKAYLVPVGTLTEDDFERLAKADERAIFDEIRHTSFGRKMLSQSTALLTAEMMKSFKDALKNMDSFMQLQTLLDAYMYVFVAQNLSGGKDADAIKRIFRKEIDAKNVLMIERMKARGFAKEKMKKYLIGGGTLFDSDVERLMEAKDFATVLTIAKEKIAGISVSAEIKDIVGLEIVLDNAIAKEKLHVFYISTLSIGTLLGFILLKEEELHNLRKIAKSKEYNIGPEKVREMLVTV